jgi:hypothetical protein
MNLLLPGGVATLIAFTTLLLLVIALITLYKSNNANKITKIIWAMVIIFAPVIGATFYLVYGRSKFSRNSL